MNGISAIQIDFEIRGLTDVTRAFETVEQRMRRLEKAGSQTAQQESETRIKVARKEVDEREKAYQKMVRELERSEANATAASLRELKKAADAKRREEERLAADMERIRRRSSEMAGRYAAQQAAAEIREAEKAKSAWDRMNASNLAMGHRIGGQLRHSIGGSLVGAASFAQSSLTIGGGFMLADAVHNELRAEKSAALFINQVTSKGEAPEGATVQAVLGRASQVSRETGMSREDVIEGTRAYAKTARGGDFKGAMANMGFFAKMSAVTGTDMGEIAGAAGMLQSQNRELASDPQKMQQMLLDLLAQTKSGSLGMGEMISQAGRIGSVRSAFQGDETTNQRKLLALGQLVAPAAGAESGIMIADLALEATKGKHLYAAKAMGVHFDNLNRIESPEQMIGAILKSTGGDIGKIGDVLGQRGGTLLRELAGGYSDARKTGGVAGGDQYLKTTIGSVTSSTMSAGDLGQQFDQMMATPSAKFEKAWNDVIDTLETRAEPYLEKFADMLPGLMPKFEAIIDEAGKLATWFADNPFKGVGAIVLGAIVKDIAQAGIGAGVESIIAKLFAAAAPPGEVPTSASAVAGAAGSAGALGLAKKWLPRALGSYAAVEGYLGILEATSAGENFSQDMSLRRSTEASNTASSLLAKTRGGTVTAADIIAAQKMTTGLNSQLAGEQEYARTGGGFWQIGGSMGSAAEARRAAGAGEAKNTEMALTSLNEAIKRSAAALEKHTTATTADVAATKSATGVRGDPARHSPIDQRNPTGD